MGKRGSFSRAFGSLLAVATALSGGVAGAAGRSGLACAAADDVAPVRDIDAALTEAGAVTTARDRPRARALYLAVLVRDPLDEEAAVGLARTDAADGCFVLAKDGARAVLSRSPSNVDARAVLADVLVQERRFADARDQLEEGLRHAPLSVELLARHARLAAWGGDARTAQRDLDEAARIAPLDPEIAEARDRVLVGLARFGQRVQIFPSGYDDLVTTDAAVMQRFGTWRFELGTTVMGRYGAARETRSGPQKTTIVDGRPSLGIWKHFANGSYLGGSVGVSAPGVTLPLLALGVGSFVPLGRLAGLHLSTAYWRYAGDRDVSILSPALVVTPADRVEVSARYWMTGVRVRERNIGAVVVSSAGARVTYRFDGRTSAAVDYTYGLQLERNPLATELSSLRSHIVTLIGQRLVERRLGLDLALSLERRENIRTGTSAIGPAIEVGVSTRW